MCSVFYVGVTVTTKSTYYGGSPSNYGRSYDILTKHFNQHETRGHAVGWGNTLQARKSRVRFPIVWHDPSGRTVALSSAQRLTNENQEHFPVVKAEGT